jgi:GLPGLI family protein
MKKTFMLMAFVAISLATSAQIRVIREGVDFKPGIACDTMRYLIYYDMQFVTDTTRHPYQPEKEMIRLEIGRHASHCMSHLVWQSDSLNACIHSRGENDYSSRGNVNWNIFRDYPDRGGLVSLFCLGMDRFACHEKDEMPEWASVDDSSATILGYECRMAVTNFKGRTWKAWFTEDIPFSLGPWKLTGLPGLILKAEDADGQFSFMAVGMKSVAQPIFYTGSDYESTDSKSLNKLLYRYGVDPVGYITGNPNVTVKVVDEHGNPTKMKKVPYNPIER